jgi:hypothetical protein
MMCIMHWGQLGPNRFRSLDYGEGTTIADAYSHSLRTARRHSVSLAAGTLIRSQCSHHKSLKATCGGATGGSRRAIYALEQCYALANGDTGCIVSTRHMVLESLRADVSSCSDLGLFMFRPWSVRASGKIQTDMQTTMCLPVVQADCLGRISWANRPSRGLPRHTHVWQASSTFVDGDSAIPAVGWRRIPDAIVNETIPSHVMRHSEATRRSPPGRAGRAAA